MSNSKLVLNIISLEGMIMKFNVTSDMTINNIKIIAIKHFYGDDKSRSPTNFRLVHTSEFKWLIDDLSVINEKVNENDELMLIKIRPIPIKENLSAEILKGPDKEIILQITKDLPICNPPKPIPFLPCPADFQNEIRKILITLVKASARIISYSPVAQKFYDILKEKLEARCKPNINTNAAKTLTEMGFSEKEVLKALHLRKSNIVEALEWLAEHQNDPENDDDDDYLDLISIEKGETGCENLKKEENVLSIVDHLLKSYHYHRKMDFKPSSRAVQSLSEMGFEEKNIIEALKITGNNQINACEWLLGERSHSLQNVDKELDPGSQIYKVIMNDPRIQLSLTNPNMLLVYLSLLESPVTISERIRDPEVGPVLDHIISMYHAEKHTIHINQYAIDF
ncbi:ubiquitin-associated domain-containing protein 1 isoform X1 [Bombus affinis]|uniref:ubiquitin-associated domain-containing protein 1 isoform X1 n=1 Tax=Bombus affinis TaxID=309941 RepID=UPI0021B6F251|nr:ubiquitin-associated domain-containing protein 1 isoform X1 [Bombus affinis]